MGFGALRGWFGGSDELISAGLITPPQSELNTTAVSGSRQGNGTITQVTISPWTSLRLNIAETLWGADNHLPGYADDVLRVVTPFGMRDGAMLLLIGAGGGGAAIRLVRRLGVRVCAREPDPVLRAAAERRIDQAGRETARRIDLGPWEPSKQSRRHPTTQFAVAFESLDSNEFESTLSALARSIRQDGHLAVLQTVATDALDPFHPAARAWCRLERRELPCLDEASLRDRLHRLSFDVRTAEDWSYRQIDHAMAGWSKVLRVLDETRPSSQDAAALVAEAELWLRRIQLLRAGQLRYLRLHAISGIRETST